MNHLTLTEREALKALYGNSDLAGGDIIREVFPAAEDGATGREGCRQLVG